jgi:hypothetical protein
MKDLQSSDPSAPDQNPPAKPPQTEPPYEDPMNPAVPVIEPGEDVDDGDAPD